VKRLTQSKEIAPYLRVGSAGLLQFVDPLEKLQFRVPVAVSGWHEGQYLLLDARGQSEKVRQTINASIEKRCVLRYLSEDKAYATELRLKHVWNVREAVLMCLAWPERMHIYPFRTQPRFAVQIPCNIYLSGALEDCQHGHVIDISERGVCLSMRHLDPSDNLEIGLMLDADAKERNELRLPIEVRTQRAFEDHVLIGAKIGVIGEESREALRNFTLVEMGKSVDYADPMEQGAQP